MNILVDFHHAGLLRGLVSLFCGRLGHNVYYPYMLDGDDQKWGVSIHDGIWGVVHEDFWNEVHPPKNTLGEYRSVTFDEFMDMDIDMILITRDESQEPILNIIRKYMEKHPILACQSGNDGIQRYDFSIFRNLLSSTWFTYRHAPDDINKVLYCQEIGENFFREFKPIEENSLKRVGCFVNNLKGFDFTFNWNHDRYINSRCPHCKSKHTKVLEPGRNLYLDWVNAVETYKDFEFLSFGHNNENIPGGVGFIKDVNLPEYYESCAVTWHVKTFEGYGFSLLQSIACGRPVIVPERFFKYRTAGRFLIPEMTCFEYDWTIEDLVRVLNRVTRSVDEANHYASVCYETSRSLFNWDHEAWKVKQWIERLQ